MNQVADSDCDERMSRLYDKLEEHTRNCPGTKVRTLNTTQLITIFGLLFAFVIGYACWNLSAQSDRDKVASALVTADAVRTEQFKQVQKSQEHIEKTVESIEAALLAKPRTPGERNAAP